MSFVALYENMLRHASRNLCPRGSEHDSTAGRVSDGERTRGQIKGGDASCGDLRVRADGNPWSDGGVGASETTVAEIHTPEDGCVGGDDAVVADRRVMTDRGVDVDRDVLRDLGMGSDKAERAEDCALINDC